MWSSKTSVRARPHGRSATTAYHWCCFARPPSPLSRSGIQHGELRVKAGPPLWIERPEHNSLCDVYRIVPLRHRMCERTGYLSARKSVFRPLAHWLRADGLHWSRVLSNIGPLYCMWEGGRCFCTMTADSGGVARPTRSARPPEGCTVQATVKSFRWRSSHVTVCRRDCTSYNQRLGFRGAASNSPCWPSQVVYR
ncbi:hypothetical protein K466DRAFT_101736 [Polyporus arcularius HHB13444]|uniref:Uncharacterized protein n=1 Tax=Polyporus arcularius HHB13444 TaxID=1314778 RepID=A0A5C3PGI9_9APHY|nr:hypothetical protein K466DRAFT_101736 [Polyporus arcularius HHB13444]